MVDFDLELDGNIDLQETFEDIEADWSDAPTYKVGTNAEYAVHLEFGRGPVRAEGDGYLKFEVDGETIFRKEVSGHPPYPFFRPAIREFQANPRTFVLDNTAYSSFQEIQNVKQLVRAVASALSKQMENNASARSSTNRSRGTHPEHPVRDTGNLVASINFQRIA